MHSISGWGAARASPRLYAPSNLPGRGAAAQPSWEVHDGWTAGCGRGQRRLAASRKEKGLRYFNHIRKSSLSIEPINKPTYIWNIDTSTTLQRLDYPLSHLTNLTKDMHINLNMPKLLIISSSLSVVPLSKLTSSP